MCPSVSQEVLDDVIKIFKKIHEENERKHEIESVTKNQVFLELKEKWSYKTIERAFNKLSDNGSIKKSRRGQYWLKEIYEKNINLLKHRLRQLVSDIKFWETVDELRVENILDLEEKLLKLDIEYTELYEELVERPKILKELRKKDTEKK